MTDRTHAMLTQPPLRLLLQMTAPNTLAFTLQDKLLQGFWRLIKGVLELKKSNMRPLSGLIKC